MSLIGTKRVWCDVRLESALRVKAEVRLRDRQVSLRPGTDVGTHKAADVSFWGLSRNYLLNQSIAGFALGRRARAIVVLVWLDPMR